MQKKALRIITNSSYNEHTDPIFKELKILKYHQIVEIAQLQHMHAVHFGYAPSEIVGLWAGNSARQGYILRNRDQINIPRSNYAFYDKMPPVAFSKTWNAYGPNKFIENVCTFRLAIRHEIFPPAEISEALEHIEHLQQYYQT
jgi:hypothetical protein